MFLPSLVTARRPSRGGVTTLAAVLFTVSFLICGEAFSQNPPLFQPVEELTLSHQTVLVIQQDVEGFFWFGTGDGLNRWDGYEMKVFRHDPLDPTTLSGNLITTIVRGQRGRLWIGTDNGVSLYDPAAQTFVRVRAGDEKEDKEVHCLLEDSHGRLWVVLTRSLWLVHPESLTAERIQIGNDPHIEVRVKALQELDGQLWLEPLDPDQPILRAQNDEGGRIRLVSAVESLSQTDSKSARPSWRSQPLPPPIQDFVPSRLADPAPSHVQPQSLETADGKTWIASRSGVVQFDPEPSEFRVYRVGEDQLSNFVNTLFEDSDGSLWVGTYNGLFRSDPFQKRFRHFFPEVRDAVEASNARPVAVSALAPEDEQRTWLATFGNGLMLWDRQEGIVRYFLRQSDDPNSLCNDFVWSLHRGGDGRLWVGTPGGVCWAVGASGIFRPVVIDPDEQSGPLNVRSITSDTAGRLWLATTTGLYTFDPASGIGSRVRAAEHSELLERPLEALLFSGPRQLWIGTADSELIDFDIEARLATSIDLTDDLPTGRGFGIWSLLDGGDGRLWIGSGLGLSRYDTLMGSIQHFGVREGLPGAVVYSLAQDPKGRLWIGTNQGLTLVERTETAIPEFTNFGRSDGLLNREFNRRASFVSSDGYVFLGGLQGVTFFDSTRLLKNPRPPRIGLTEIEIESRSGNRNISPFQLEEVVLQPGDHALSFQFTALSFTSPKRNRYQYRLEGLDPGWVEAGNQRSVRYAGLSPGEYMFHVSASNGDGVWNREGRSIAVTVLPPLWQKLWFQLLVGAILMGTILLIYHYRVSRLLEMQRLRLRVAEDLHDDLGSNLSAVALLGESLLRREQLQEHQREQLQRIASSARQMVEDLRDIVWMVDPKQDTLQDLVARMREVAKDLLSETNYSFEGPPAGSTETLGMETRRQLFLVFKEAVHNAASHAAAKQVVIALRREADQLVLSVSDDGKGFAEGGSAGQGLRSMKRRSERMGAQLDIESGQGQGTRLTLRVKIT